MNTGTFKMMGKSVIVGQRGSVLAIVIILLIFASLLSLFAVNVGTFEQRTSGNDVRSKLVQQVADAALTQGVEYALGDDSFFTTGLGTTWTLCAATDQTFPCGAVDAGVANSVRRATMWRYNNTATGSSVDVLGDGTAGDNLDQRMLPLTQNFTRVNDSTATSTDGFPVNYGVGVVMCRLVPQDAGTPPVCSTNAGQTVRLHAFTTVAIANMPGEGARSTVAKTFSTNTSFGLGANQPPIMASGPIDIRGNLQVVTSPNAGGPGVPVSVWSRKALDAGGTPDTCYADEFFRLGAKNNSAPTLYPSGASSSEQTLRCDDCNCGGGPITEVQGNGGSAMCAGASDVLTFGGDCSVNRPVRDTEFPCDMFKHVFGEPAWTHADGHDGRNADVDETAGDTAGVGGTHEDVGIIDFCEAQIPIEDPEDSTKEIGADQNYLAEKADWIIPKGTSPYTGTFDARFAGDGRVITCAQLEWSSTSTNNKSGIVWDRTGACGDGKVIGSPGNPVLLVADSSGNLPAYQNMILFGVLFVRSTSCDGPFAPRSPECTLSESTGGSAELRFNAGTVIYGSAVVQGQVVKANGTAAVVYDSKVLGNLTEDLSKPDVYGLPGSWTDVIRY